MSSLLYGRGVVSSGPLTLGIDIGTGSAKGVIADTEGAFFASATYAYSFSSTEPEVAEQSAEDWWDAVCHITRSLLEAYPEASSRLSAIGISGQGAALVALDQSGKPLRNAMLWMDTRCAAQAKELAHQHGAEIAAISGKLPAAYNVEPKMFWLQENEPHVWDKVFKVVTTTAYINFRLTGELVMNHSDAGIMLSYDLKQRCWSDEVMAMTKLPRSVFCDLAACHVTIGSLTEQAAQQTGLPVGLPVIAGGEDTSSAGLAMGVMTQSDVQLSMGSACTIYVPLPEPVSDPRLLSFPHVLEGLTLMGGSMVSGGLSIDWLLKLLYVARPDQAQHSRLIHQLTAGAEQVPCGSKGLIFAPYLAGELQPINDGYARGMFFGLSLDTSREQMFRAVMEGTAYAILHNLTIVREHGALLERILAVGRPTENDLWCQIIADVVGLPLYAMEDRAGAAFGDALLAALGAGLLKDARTMQKAHAKVRKEFHPSATAHAHYQKLHAIYRELYPRLQDLFPLLASSSVYPNS